MLQQPDEVIGFAAIVNMEKGDFDIILQGIIFF